VLVEMAVVGALLVTLVLGVFEIGSLWGDHQVLTHGARSGARVGSQLGTAPETDQQVLRAIEAAFGPMMETIDRVVVYEAGSNGEMPVACETASAGYSGSGHCNVYDATAFANLDTAPWWGSGTACGTADGNWCSVTDRSDDQATATYLGVSVEMERPYLTGLFGGGTHLMTDTTVMRIEPET
jgi:Flp pilus assembly protein TadG